MDICCTKQQSIRVKKALVLTCALSVLAPVFADKIEDQIRKAPSWPAQLTGSVGDMSGARQTIHGQCFIVTRGGQSIKLALVTVRIVSASTWEALWKEVSEATGPRYKYWDGFLMRALHENQISLSGVYLEIMGDELQKIWELLPPCPRAKTDAEGKFELTHTMAGSFVVIAEAKRTVGDKIERYSWKAPSSQIDADGYLMLSNDNVDR